jgi:hypothetical protein
MSATVVDLLYECCVSVCQLYKAYVINKITDKICKYNLSPVDGSTASSRNVVYSKYTSENRQCATRVPVKAFCCYPAVLNFIT